MTNFEVILLDQLAKGASYVTLPSSDSYKLFSLFRKVRKAAAEIESQRVELYQKNNVPVTKDDPTKLDSESKEFKKFNEEYSALLEDDANIEYKKLHGEAFMDFCKENKMSDNDAQRLADLLLMDEDVKGED